MSGSTRTRMSVRAPGSSSMPWTAVPTAKIFTAARPGVSAASAISPTTIVVSVSVPGRTNRAIENSASPIENVDSAVSPVDAGRWCCLRLCTVHLQSPQFVVHELPLHPAWLPLTTTASLTHIGSGLCANEREWQSAEDQRFDSLWAHPSELETPDLGACRGVRLFGNGRPLAN